MYIVQVHIHVKQEFLDEFLRATVENASQSILEPGIARFDVLQQEDDPTRILLTEVYRSTKAAADHKETLHYLKWRDTVAEMMAENRRSIKYSNIYPNVEGW